MKADDATTLLPNFRYHPDPLGSGSVVVSPAKCRCCSKARGFIYTGPVYAEAELEDALCPWCIADGSAHARFDARFVDSEAFDAGASEKAIEEIMTRTPGFSTWTSERWPSCDGEPAAFVGPFGIEEIRGHYRDLEGTLMSYVVHDLGISGGAARRVLESLQRDGNPTAFVFCSLVSSSLLAYVDQVDESPVHRNNT